MFRSRSLVWGTVYVGSHDIIEYEILLLLCRPQQLETETSRLKREGLAPKDLGSVIDRSLIAHLLFYTYFTVLQLLSSHIMIAQRLRCLIAYLRRFVVTSRHGVLACGGFVGFWVCQGREHGQRRPPTRVCRSYASRHQRPRRTSSLLLPM